MKDLAQFHGGIDVATRSRVAGWIVNLAAPDEPVSLLITVNGTLLARVLANRAGADPAASDLDENPDEHRRRFDLAIHPLALPAGPCQLDIRREADGADIPGSPVTLPPVTALDAGVQTAFALLLETPCDDAELRRRIAFMARQTERLLEWRAATQNVLGERLVRAEHRWGWNTPTPAPQPQDLQRRALVIADSVPTTGGLDGADAILSHIQSLQRLGYTTSFVAADMIPGAGPFELEALGAEECLAPWFMSVEEVMRGRLGQFDLVYLHGVHVAACYAALVRHYQPGARLLYGVAELLHLRLQRQATAERQPELQTASRHARAQEMMAATTADAVLTHSTVEAEMLRRDLPRGRVHLVPLAIAPHPTEVPFEERSGVAFIGNLAHRANLDAAFRLVEEIMPLVWQQDSGIECFLIGAPPLEPQSRLARPGVELVGPVADLTEVFDRVRVTVAPLAFGAGVCGAVLDSMAAGVPCVCSPLAAEAVALPAPLASLVGADPAAIASGILAMHGDAAANAAAAAAGLATIADRHSTAALDSPMRAATGQA